MTDLDKAAREWADENDYIYPEAAPFKAGHARGVADERVRLGALLDKFDSEIRWMHSRGEINIREMVIALKPIMWMSDAYEAGNGK